MRFRYIDNYGNEHGVENIPALARLIQHGDIRAETLLHDATIGTWMKAREHDVFQAVGAEHREATGVARHASLADHRPPQTSDATLPVDTESARESPSDSGLKAPGKEGTESEIAQATDQSGSPNPLFSPRGHIAVLALATIVATFMTTPTYEDWLPRIASGFGYALGATAIGALFVIWTKDTRRLIPLAGLVLTVALGWIGVQEDERRAREIDSGVGQLEAIVAELAASDGDATRVDILPAEDLPGSAEGRMLWATQRIVADHVAFLDSLQRHYGANEDPPTGWWSPEYLANASAHPGVPRYWRSYRQYVAAVRTHFSDRYMQSVHRYVQEARLPVDLRDPFVANAEASLAEGFPNLMAALDTLAAFAIDLHAFLVRHESAIRVDEERGLAVTDDLSVERRLMAYLNDLERVGQRVADLQGQHLQNARSLVEELREHVPQ